MKLVIVGNGFDLHHGLKTSFNSFRQYLLDNDKSEVVSNIDAMINKHKKSLKAVKDELDWNNIEVILNLEFESLHGYVDKIEKLEELFEEFIEEFYEYLVREEARTNINVNPIIRNMVEDATVYLVFNYTQTYNLYLTDGVEEVFHIHGKLDKENLPLIGYHRGNLNINNNNNTDYYSKYNGFVFHKPAMAYKQNLRDMESDIKNFIIRNKQKITDVVVLGYSFGDSDAHVYQILNDILISQKHSRNMHYIEAEKLPKINFFMFNYDETETNDLINKISNTFKQKLQRNIEVSKFGNGIRKSKEELIKFTLVNY